MWWFVSHFHRIRNKNIPFLVLMSLSVLFFSCAPRPSGPTQAPDQTWLDIPLKDVLTDRQFKLSDFKGKVVVLETMAVWCTTCTRQQIEIRNSHSQLGDDFVSISLDIDPNENEALVKKYAQTNGFNWTFAISPPEFSRQLENIFGSTVLNPPSTPVIIVDKDQNTRLMRSGLKSTKELVEEISRYR